MKQNDIVALEWFSGNLTEFAMRLAFMNPFGLFFGCAMLFAFGYFIEDKKRKKDFEAFLDTVKKGE